MRDNDTVNMDPVGDGIVTLKKRQVRIFLQSQNQDIDLQEWV